MSLTPYPLSLALLLTLPLSANAQTLARPGWAGSGMDAQSWWHNAVLYRVVTRGFQDSDGDGAGDLRGIANRMDYLQSLGIDAVVLDNPLLKPNSDDGFDEVVSAATQRRIRVLVTLEDSNDAAQNDLIAQARMWLTRGAAGIFLHSPRPAAETAPLLRSLRALTDSFPGNRILVAETATNPAPGNVHAITLDFDAPPPAPRGRPAGTAAGAQLTAAPLELTNATATTIRAALNGVNNAPAANALLLTEQILPAQTGAAPDQAQLDGRRRAFALVLLASRGAAALRYGQEIGMSPLLPSADPTRTMQWTPSNITHPTPPAPAPQPDAAVPAPTPPAPSDVYGEFKPYVPPPKPQPSKPAASAPAIGLAPPPVDPDTLAGFTTGALPPPTPGDLSPADAATLNVAREYPDPASLLNLYRRLIELRQDYPTLRNGAETMLDYDDLGAVVWVRQPPRGSTATAIVAVCNLSARPLHLSLNAELARERIHAGSIRNLLATAAAQDTVQSTGDLALPAFGVFLGELYH